MQTETRILFFRGTALAALLAAATTFTGCAGYRLGSMLPPEIKTVFVPVVENNTTEPNIEFQVTQELISRIQLDGSLKVTTEENADAVLRVVLTDYSLAPTAFEQERATAAEEYRATLTARIVMTQIGTGRVLAEHPRVRGETTFPLQGDLTTSKRTALPDAARDLAHDIVEIVVEYW